MLATSSTRNHFAEHMGRESSSGSQKDKDNFGKKRIWQEKTKFRTSKALIVTEPKDLYDHQSIWGFQQLYWENSLILISPINLS